MATWNLSALMRHSPIISRNSCRLRPAPIVPSCLIGGHRLLAGRIIGRKSVSKCMTSCKDGSVVLLGGHATIDVSRIINGPTCGDRSMHIHMPLVSIRIASNPYGSRRWWPCSLIYSFIQAAWASGSTGKWPLFWTRRQMGNEMPRGISSDPLFTTSSLKAAHATTQQWSQS